MKELISKSELIDLIGVKGNFTKSESTRFINLFFETICEKIKEDNKIQIKDFGSFLLVEQKAYTGRNPKTGESVYVPEKKTIRFKPSKNLKNFLNNLELDENDSDEDSDELTD